MADNTYLTAPFKDREKVKSLGARWDPDSRRWFVPAGRDLAPFDAWLPSDQRTGTAAMPLVSGDVAIDLAPTNSELVVARKGVTLTQLLAGVAQAIAQAYRAGVWTMVEVVDARLRNGHVYLEVSERTSSGEVAAKASAVIWANVANRILPEFERATGAKVGPGIKLLLRMRPVLKPQYGFSLEVDAMDPEFTLGDLEAKKREIRQRLQRDGLYDANKKLPAPWDFNAVLVVAPEAAAGLGDFQAEAARLARFGVCRFIYAHSRFQGEGAAAGIRDELLSSLDAWRGRPPDAVVLIRGGGAVNDLAWLNDYDLARCICELEVPVFTGIGHERDSTVLDEVAHTRFDTPSKVILGIEQVIRSRVHESKEAFATVLQVSDRVVVQQRRDVEQLLNATVTGSLHRLSEAKQQVEAGFAAVRLGAVQSLLDGRALAHQVLGEVQHQVRQQVALARQSTPALVTYVLESAQQQTRLLRQDIDRDLGDVATNARRVVAEASKSTEALMREVAGQGPEKTLGRGFALVRTLTGETITRATQAAAGQDIQVHFSDGAMPARVTKEDNGK